VLVTIFSLNCILNACGTLDEFSTISTFDPSVFLKATLGNDDADPSVEAILTAPGLTNFEA
jgi:hypothetical protein